MKKFSKSPLLSRKSMQLFSDSEVFSRKKTSQKEFEESIGRDCAGRIVYACEKGIQKTKEELRNRPPSYQNRNYKPNLANSNIQGCLIEEFPMESNFCKGGRYCLTINNQRLFCKKVRKDFRPSNILTKAVTMYNDQATNDISDIFPITYIGYQVSETFSELTGVYAIHVSEGEIEWICDLAGLAITEEYHTPNSNIEISDEDNSEMVVRAKHDARKNKKIG